MKPLQETTSNPPFDLESRYCQYLVEKIYSIYMEKERAMFTPEVRSGTRSWHALFNNSTEADNPEENKKYFVTIEQMFKNVCLNPLYEEEYRLNYYDSMIVLSKFLSSKPNVERQSEPGPLRTNIGEFISANADILWRTSDKTEWAELEDSDYTYGLVSSNQFKVDAFEEIHIPHKEVQEIWTILAEFSKLPEGHLKILSQLSSEILYFCYQQKLLQSLPNAINLTQEVFCNIDEQQIRFEVDPETGEEWLVIDITLPGEVDEVLDQYERYTNLFVSSVPWPDRSKIRLSFNII